MNAIKYKAPNASPPLYTSTNNNSLVIFNCRNQGIYILILPLHKYLYKIQGNIKQQKIPLTPPGCVLASLSDLIFHRLTHLCSQTNYCNIIKKEKSNNFFNDLNQPGPQLLNIFCIHQKLIYVTRPVVIELSLDRCPYIADILSQSEPGSDWNFDMVLFF